MLQELEQRFPCSQSLEQTMVEQVFTSLHYARAGSWKELQEEAMLGKGESMRRTEWQRGAAMVWPQYPFHH